MNNDNEIVLEGIVSKILDKEVITLNNGNNLHKRKVIINNGRDFKNMASIDFINKYTFLVEDIKQGDYIECSVNVYSKEYNDRYYTHVEGYKVQKKDKSVWN